MELDSFFDSEDLISWLLLNNETFGESQEDLDRRQVKKTVYQTQKIKHEEEEQYNAGEKMKIESANEVDSDDGEESLYETKPGRKYGGGEDEVCERGLKRKKTSSAEGKQTKKRNKETVEDLQLRVVSLQAENVELQAHLANVTQRTTEVQRQR